ncbi:unnamed protein product [Brassica rapa subsp. trilocularis]
MTCRNVVQRSLETTRHLRLPTPACCTVAKTANLECLCPFLSRSGIDPAKLKALFANCGVNNPSCLPWSVNTKVPLTIL